MAKSDVDKKTVWEDWVQLNDWRIGSINMSIDHDEAPNCLCHYQSLHNEGLCSSNQFIQLQEAEEDLIHKILKVFIKRISDPDGSSELVEQMFDH
jgi:hypothetical protein